MTLTDQDIHIYHFPIEPNVSPKNHQHILSKTELTRANRFVKEIDQHKYRFCYVKLRTVLANYLNCQPNEITFTKNAYEKPLIAKHQNTIHLEFNMSHSKSHMVLAVCLHHPIGIDIEETNRETNHVNLAEYAFSPDEFNAFQELPDTKKLAGFYHLWTAKEAFLKAIGTGMHFPLKDFTISANPDTSPKLISINSEHHHPNDWTFKQFQLTENTLTTACYHPTKSNVTEQSL